jgi:hypothetical protein
MWDHIENSVTKSELRAAVAVIDELIPVDDAELNGQRLEELSGRLATVRIFLPSMMGTVEFGATSDRVPVLAAMKTLAKLMTAKTKTRVSAAKPVTQSSSPGVGGRRFALSAQWTATCRLQADRAHREGFGPDRPRGTPVRSGSTPCLLTGGSLHERDRSDRETGRGDRHAEPVPPEGHPPVRHRALTPKGLRRRADQGFAMAGG